MSAPNSSRNAVATALIAALLVLALPAMLPAEETPSDALRLTILYDNYEGSDGLVSHWGFSCLVEGLSRTILFDTGQLGGMLEYNCDRLGCELQNVDIIVLSHEHLDHAGGIETVLKHAPAAQLVHPPVCLRTCWMPYMKVGAQPLQPRPHAPSAQAPVQRVSSGVAHSSKRSFLSLLLD